MNQIKHKETCILSGEIYDDSYSTPKDCCSTFTFQEWLPHIAPDLFWFDIQDVGSYQGSVYGVAKYKKQIVIYEGYYGSCSGCGAWGEGGEPVSQDEVLKSCTIHDNAKEAIKAIAKLDHYDNPDKDKMIEAVEHIESLLEQ